ncbi:MAG: MarR family transcriptional regulator [Desulfobacteraceae bacterium]|jgi:DNA-binding MarR family transcriptional regulator
MKNKSQKKQSPSAEAVTELILTTFRFNGLLQAAGDRLTKDLNLSSALWQVLGAIRDAPLSMAQIARNMGQTRQSVRRNVNVLQERGFVEFRKNPDHQRAKLVVLTDKGRTVLEEAGNINIDWTNHIADGLNISGLNAAIRIIKKLCDRLQVFST